MTGAQQCISPDLVNAHYNDRLRDPHDDFNQGNGFQANHNILLAEGNPYGSYLAATPYDLRLQVYPPANVSTLGMSPYATMPYDPCLQAYAPANVLTPGLAPYTTPYELGPPFAQGHAFAKTTTTPSPYPASINNLNPENSSNLSTAGTDHASKPRSVCITSPAPLTCSAMPRNMELLNTFSAPLQAVSMLVVIARISLISMLRICIRSRDVLPYGWRLSV